MKELFKQKREILYALAAILILIAFAAAIILNLRFLFASVSGALTVSPSQVEPEVRFNFKRFESLNL